ncbi:MAG: terminase small subunit [Chitinophagaceae bacterium]|nr:terminase small subunit [Microcystis sp. M065S1]MCA6492268.1 terminase small subunit [Chitinophagaceae bacterium]
MLKLSKKQLRFAEEYMIDFNGAQAAIRAGYTANSAKIHAVRLLKNKAIHDLIEQKRKELSERIGVSVDKVVNELAKHAFQDVRKYYDQNGVLKKISELDECAAAVVVGVETEIVNGVGTQKFKRTDPVKALELLGKHLGIFAADNVQKKDDLIVVLTGNK